MWIKEPNRVLGKSLNDTVNFLYKEDNVYVMDNHLAAAWSWLDTVDPRKSHYLLHIDRHYDLLSFSNTVQAEILDKEIELSDLSFQAYLDLRQYGNNGDSWPLFRWANYILNLKLVYPDFYKETYFSTRDNGCRGGDFIDHDMRYDELLSSIGNLVESKNDAGWIINLDIDYFFHNDDLTQVHDDQEMRELATQIKKILDKVEVFTICLSPECCGGWGKSLQKTKIICEIIGIDFISELEKKTSFEN
jgi:hypothetical protein